MGSCQKVPKFNFQIQFFTLKIIGIFLIFLHWENTVRSKCEYGFLHITNAKKCCQITSERRVILRVFGMSDVQKAVLTFAPHSILSLLKTAITQIWQKKMKNLSNCCKVCTWVFCRFVKCVHDSLFNSFFTIAVFNNEEYQLISNFFVFDTFG